MVGVTSLAAPTGAPETFRFSTDTVPERDRFAIWHEVLNRRFVHLDSTFTSDDGWFRSVGVRFPSLGIVAPDSSPMRISRTQQNLADAEDGVRLVLLRRTGGPAFVTQGKRDATVNPVPENASAPDPARCQ
jgi:hypothetical protein